MKVPPKRRRNVVHISEVRHSASDLYVFPLASQQEEYGHITCAMFCQDVGNTARAYLSPAHKFRRESAHCRWSLSSATLCKRKEKTRESVLKGTQSQNFWENNELTHPVKILHCNYSASCKNVLPRTCTS